jgi:hypothetical protein
VFECILDKIITESAAAATNSFFQKKKKQQYPFPQFPNYRKTKVTSRAPTHKKWDALIYY